MTEYAITITLLASIEAESPQHATEHAAGLLRRSVSELHMCAIDMLADKKIAQYMKDEALKVYKKDLETLSLMLDSAKYEVQRT